MDAITYTAVRANLASAMDRVCDDHEALIITRNGEQSVVMLSPEDYKAQFTEIFVRRGQWRALLGPAFNTLSSLIAG